MSQEETQRGQYADADCRRPIFHGEAASRYIHCFFSENFRVAIFVVIQVFMKTDHNMATEGYDLSYFTGKLRDGEFLMVILLYHIVREIFFGTSCKLQQLHNILPLRN